MIGDVHAEDELLDVALRAARDLGVRTIACTGDVVDGRGAAARCCALLREHHVWCVRGNHDRWLFTGVLRDVPGSTRLDELSDEDRAFLRTLLPTRDVPISGGLMLLCHGIGTADLEKITSFDSEYSLRRNRHLHVVMQGSRYRVMVNGHSHERLTIRVDDFVAINAGALCGPDPGFLDLDFAANLMRWCAIRGSRVFVADESAIFSR